MGIKDTFSQAPSPKEEALYKRVLDEVEAGVMRKGIFAKAQPYKQIDDLDQRMLDKVIDEIRQERDR